jgi:hypothetical protein
LLAFLEEERQPFTSTEALRALKASQIAAMAAMMLMTIIVERMSTFTFLDYSRD